MTNSSNSWRLVLSPPEVRAAQAEIEAKKTAYRRQYWQKYNKRVRRVFGTLSPAQYSAVRSRADKGGRSVWAQIWAESEAYHRGAMLPTEELADGQRRLIAELRRIGNNINQLAKLGHLQAKRAGLAPSPNDRIGAEAVRQFERLEAAVSQFENSSPRDDHQIHGS